MQNLALVEKVDELAKAKGVKPGQLALAWVHAQVLSSSPSSDIALHHRSCLDALLFTARILNSSPPSCCPHLAAAKH